MRHLVDKETTTIFLTAIPQNLRFGTAKRIAGKRSPYGKSWLNDMPTNCGEPIEEVLIVTDQEQATGTLLQRGFETLNRWQIEMI